MSAPTGPWLLVVHRPALAVLLQEQLTLLTGAGPERAPSLAAALGAGQGGGLAGVVVDVATRGLTPEHIATLTAAGTRVVLVAHDEGAVGPALTAAGAALIRASALTDPTALAAVLNDQPRADRTDSSATPSPAPADAAPTAIAAPASPSLASASTAPATGSYARRFAARRSAPSEPTTTLLADTALPGETTAPLAAALPLGGPTTTPPVNAPPVPTSLAAVVGMPRDRPATGAATAAAPAPIGRVLGLLGTGSGSGTTLTAHAVADALAAPDRPVIVLDCDATLDRTTGLLGLTQPGGGLAALALAGAPGSPGWERLFDGELRPAGAWLRVLPGLARPSEAGLIGEACLTAVVAAARRRATWVVVDLGRWSAHPWHRAARLACDDRLLVATPTGPGVQAARATLRELADEAPGRIGRLVLTRAGGPAAFPAAEIAAQLGWPVAAILPDDPAAIAWAVARQTPVTRAPGALGAAVRRLADRLVADTRPVVATMPPSPLVGARRRRARLPQWTDGPRRSVGRRLRPLLAQLTRLIRPRPTSPRPEEVLHDPA